MDFTIFGRSFFSLLGSIFRGKRSDKRWVLNHLTTTRGQYSLFNSVNVAHLDCWHDSIQDYGSYLTSVEHLLSFVLFSNCACECSCGCLWSCEVKIEPSWQAYLFLWFWNFFVECFLSVSDPNDRGLQLASHLAKYDNKHVYSQQPGHPEQKQQKLLSPAFSQTPSLSQDPNT